VDRLTDELTADGYRFVTLDELLRHDETGPGPGSAR
jgi:hypothetical protein